MNRADLVELHYIAPIANLASIMQHGIVSHRLAEGIRHASVAMTEIQELRVGVVVPGGRPLHDYVNLYLCARNPMMYKRKDDHDTLCVLRVSTAVLDLPGAVITDRNAAARDAQFMPSPGGLAAIDRELVFAEYWTDNDLFAYWRKKSAKCTEVLVPDRVPPSYLMGTYVSGPVPRQACQAAAPDLAVTVDTRLFFR